MGWDAALPRVVTWGHLRDRTSGEAFYHFNTHFDHRGEEARLESARLIRARIGAIAGEEPFVLTGDFNTTEEDPPYGALTDVQADSAVVLRDAYYATAEAPYGPAETFHGFEVGGAVGGRIDYVFRLPGRPGAPLRRPRRPPPGPLPVGPPPCAGGCGSWGVKCERRSSKC